MTNDLLRRVVGARVVDVLPNPTPLDDAVHLSARVGRRVLLKREDLTPVFSFKLRGAYNRMAQLDPNQLAGGVVASSAGNHAQGVAYSARRLGASALIVMPCTTPSIKVDAVRRFGAEIELVGDSYSDAAARCQEIAATTTRTVIPPFDDIDVIAGQGTVGLEILRQAPRDLASIFVPVGGGGLAAGVASVVKEIRPHVKVFGVEPDDCDAMAQSLAAGRRVALDHVGIFADGVAVKLVGEVTFPLCQKYLDGCLTVTTDEICAAIKEGFEDTRSILEAAGALSIAGLTRMYETGALPEGPAIAIASGANIPFAKLGYVSERAEMGEHHEAIFAVRIPERTGAFLAFCQAIGDRAVTEFNYRLGARDEADIFVGVEVTSFDAAEALADSFKALGYSCRNLTDSDLAKTHLRHMVGGRAAEARDECLYTVDFPERPGALRQFLVSLGARWNISLFHYRNHGSAFGRVLCGFEVPQSEREDLVGRLDALGFDYEDVTASPEARFLLAGD